jgi:hypothetical protein
MIVEGVGRLLVLVAATALFSTPALACESEGKIEISLKKQDYHHKDCIALYLEFPDHFGMFDKASVSLGYSNGPDQLLHVVLQVDDYKKDDGKLATGFCLTEEMLKHTSVTISWDHINEHGFSQSAWCNTSMSTGNLFELLEAGTKLVAPSGI